MKLSKLQPKKLGLFRRIPAVAPPRESPAAKRQRKKQLSALAIDLQRVALKDNIVRQLKCLGHTEKCTFVLVCCCARFLCAHLYVSVVVTFFASDSKDTWPSYIQHHFVVGRSWSTIPVRVLKAIELTLDARIKAPAPKLRVTPAAVHPSPPPTVPTSLLALCIRPSLGSSDNDELGAAFIYLPGGGKKPTLLLAHLGLHNAQSTLVEALFPLFNDMSTIIVMQSDISMQRRELLVAWLGRPISYVCVDVPYEPAVVERELDRTIASNIFGGPSVAQGGKVTVSTAVRAAPDSYRSLLQPPNSKTASVSLSVGALVPAVAVLMALQALARASGGVRSAPNVDGMYAGLPVLLRGAVDAVTPHSHSGVAMTMPITQKRKRGVADPAPASVEPKLPVKRTPIAIFSDEDLEHLDTAKKWCTALRVRPYAPRSWDANDIVGRLLISSFRREDGVVDWDCAIVHKFDMDNKRCSLQKVYPPYALVTTTSHTWRRVADHFVVSFDKAVPKPEDSSFLPWMLADFPENPCVGFPKKPVLA